MIGQHSSRSIQQRALELRLVEVGAKIQATILGNDGGSLAFGEAIKPADFLSRAMKAMVDHRFERPILRAVGVEMGRIAFPGDVGNFLVAQASLQPIRLRISAEGDLALIPWELAILAGFGSGNQDFLALCPQISVIRHVPGSQKPPRHKVATKRILVAWANPGSVRYPHLYFLEKEAEGVIRALRCAECDPIDVDELPFATVSSLLSRVTDWQPDVLHFVGHGEAAPNGGAIVLEGGLPFTETLLRAEDLASSLIGAGTTLAVLSGCLTGGTPSAIGSKLAAAGVPAVLAMSIPILDIAAHQFARAMYSTLAVGGQLDEAVFEGRCALAGIGSDFAAPQLMMSGTVPVVLATEKRPRSRVTTKDPKTNLTYDERPFIGRSLERAELREKIRDEGWRVVTITGPAGFGKTRLAKQVAAELLDEFADGVWYIDGAPLHGQKDVAGAIAGLPFLEPRNADSQNLIPSLTRNRALIVLDSFQFEACDRSFLEELLRSAVGLCFLLASRTALAMPLESEFVLGPMPVRSTRGKTADSVSLFVQEAGYLGYGHNFTGKNRKLISDICSAVNGVPLEILSAAARLRRLTLAELSEQICREASER